MRLEEIVQGSALGTLHIMFDNGSVASFEDADEVDGMWWCDALTDDNEYEYPNEIGSPQWLNFNLDRVLAIEWVKYGEERFSLLARLELEQFS